MAKQDRKPYEPATPAWERPEETPEEQPPLTIETVQEGIPAAEVAADPDFEETYAVDDTGEISVVRTRLGYAPAPLPFGSRLATDEEIASYKAPQAPSGGEYSGLGGTQAKPAWGDKGSPE